MPGDNGKTEAGGEEAGVAVVAPRAMKILVPGLPPFDTTDEPNTLWMKWTKFIRLLNLYLAAKGVDSDGHACMHASMHACMHAYIHVYI